MTEVVAFFNHKGGVSKTTTAFHLGWKLAERGRSVLLVDADPQCNLTGLVLGYSGETELEAFYAANEGQTLKDGLRPAFESRPEPMEPLEPFPVRGCAGLSIVPGHIEIAEYETTLGIAQELSGSIYALRNIPGSVINLVKITAAHVGADYVFVDLSPGLGPLNQNLISIADWFLVPVKPDYFSLMALDSLNRVLPRWRRWAEAAGRLDALKDAAYPFPEPRGRLLGTVIQNFTIRGERPSKAFRDWIERIENRTDDVLLPTLRSCGMALDESEYEAAGLLPGHALALIANFQSLVAKSQKSRTPVFALTDDQLAGGGQMLANYQKMRARFEEAFETLADRVELLTSRVPATTP
jgi:cellulose biosynthesis protein BcsQ